MNLTHDELLREAGTTSFQADILERAGNPPSTWGAWRAALMSSLVLLALLASSSRPLACS